MSASAVRLGSASASANNRAQTRACPIPKEDTRRRFTQPNRRRAPSAGPLKPPPLAPLFQATVPGLRMPIRCDYLVIGGGVAGLTFALEAAKSGDVLLVTKRELDESATNYAQGGIAA